LIFCTVRNFFEDTQNRNRENRSRQSKNWKTDYRRHDSKSIQKLDGPEISKIFKTIIIDECHHIPAKSYAATISKLSPYYQYGLTATPL